MSNINLLKGKKFYIGVDCEGVACAVGSPGVGLSGSENFSFAQRQATREADAAARALLEQGAGEVWVWDNHHSGVNLDYDQLDPRCRIVLGSGSKTRFPGIDERFGGVLFIGYHAREGTPDGVLAHTYSSAAYQSYTINGLQVGEMEIDAAFAGIHGVPVMFAASDAACVAQARESFPWAETLETKQGLGWNAAVSLHPKAACDAIFAGVTKACQRLSEMRPYTFRLPMEVSIRYKRMDAAAADRLYDQERCPFACPDGFTRTGTLARLEDLFN